MILATPSYGGSAGRPPGTGRLLETVVDVEVPGQGPPAVQPQHPGQPRPAQGTGVADRVVVEAPGQAHPDRRALEVGAEGGRHAPQVARQLPQLAAEGVLGQLAVAVHGPAGTPGQRGPGPPPAPPPGRGGGA